ncbi:MAG: hypothetical protein KGJ60_15480, partial [Verrucomicrobiota bacterium]|nr:hypothetical protein [Verrucomicrobiota bacterium]
MQEISHAPGVIGVTPMTAGGTPALPEISIVRIIGEPTTPNEAATLAEEDKYQFQWWALGLVSARPVEQKKGANHGIDGKFIFRQFTIGFQHHGDGFGQIGPRNTVFGRRISAMAAALFA